MTHIVQQAVIHMPHIFNLYNPYTLPKLKILVACMDAKSIFYELFIIVLDVEVEIIAPHE